MFYGAREAETDHDHLGRLRCAEQPHQPGCDRRPAPAGGRKYHPAGHDHADRKSVDEEETTFTNSAAAVAQSGAKPESAAGVHRALERGREDRDGAAGNRRAAERHADIRAVIDNRLQLMLLLEEE